MSPRGARLVRSLGAALAGAALAGVTIVLHLALAPPEPGAALALAPAVMLRAVALVPPLALLATFSGPWPFKALSTLLFATGWYWIAQGVAGALPAPSGGGWLAGEAFDAVFYRPILTPALWAIAAISYFALLGRLNRVQDDLHQSAAATDH